MNLDLLKEYASLLVRCGANVQAGQVVVVKGPVEAYEFIRLVVKEAYVAGAKHVVVEYEDLTNLKNSLFYKDIKTLENIPSYELAKFDYEVSNNACFISLTAPNPDALRAIEPNKLQTYNRTLSKAKKEVNEYTMKSVGQWTVAGVATLKWAEKVFPNDSEAVEKLWKAILEASRVSVTGSIKNWQAHSEEIEKHAKLLNSLNLKKLHFKNDIGTDLVVELADKNIFAGGDEYSKSKVRFSPNIPTEEVFGMPHKLRVNGKVVSTKPLIYQGGLIDDFSLIFKDGKVIEYSAKKGIELLKNLLEFDEGSSYLGEVALISHNSPISNQNILFYNTLFDENASCHLALGAAYPMNTLNGNELSEEELISRGCNISNTHVDFMFGSSDMEVIGTSLDGKDIKIFENGNFVI